MPERPDSPDPLTSLGEHLRATQEAARALTDTTARSTFGGERARSDDPPGSVPPSGWEVPPGQSGSAGRTGAESTAELQALIGLVLAVRELLPEELQDQLTEVVRQLLLLARAVIDWLVGRLEREGRGQELEVEDIPVL